MNIKHLLQQSIHSVALSATILLSSNAVAAPLALQNQPVYTSTSVEPNIYFSYDDSSSMSMSPLMSPVLGIDTTYGLPIIGGVNRMFFYHAYYPDQFTYPPLYKDVIGERNGSTYANVNYKNLWVLRNHQTNKMAYSTYIDYKPWVGHNENADFTTARYHPNNTGTVDLTESHDYEPSGGEICTSNSDNCKVYYPTFYIRQDPSAPFSLNETPARYEIRAGNTFPSGRSYLAEMQNFATWFTFNSTRETVAKSAMGRIINKASGVRMGIDYYNSYSWSTGVPNTNSRQNYSRNKIPRSMTDKAQRDDFLNDYYASTAPGGTPTTNSYMRVIEKYRDTTTNSIIFDEDKGGECQQNFIMIVTDGQPTNTKLPTLGNADANTNSTFDGPPYADSFSNTLADLAMDAYKEDLRPLYLDKVPTKEGVDEASHQHIVTYTIAFGLNGNIDINSDPSATDFAGWTTDPDYSKGPGDYTNNPIGLEALNLSRADDLFHASYNGRGKALSASSPQELETSLNAAIHDISTRTSSMAAAAVNSAKLTTDTVVYLASFNTNKWSGDLTAHPISNENTGELAPSKWSDAANNSAGAAAILTEMDFTTRSVFTYNSDNSTGVQFTANGTGLSTIMNNDFNSNVPTADPGLTAPVVATLATSRRNYILGDRSHEGVKGDIYRTRTRASILGDIVNSGPIFVGQPSLNWPDTADFIVNGKTYSDFKASQKSRESMVYVGSNDGMLHAFADADGKEKFAYLPNLLSSSDSNRGYHYLSNESYAHQWYVDLTPTVSDITLGSSWKTVLVGGLRGGGRGIFALDVTDPYNMSTSSVLWEFTANTDTNGDGKVDRSDNNDPDLGYTYSTPVIAMANNGKWYAFFGNGYNDTGSGTAQLFVVGLEGMNSGGSTDNKWTLGTDYYKITTSTGSSGTPNGLSSPALVDIDGDSKVDRVYAGDLEGNMWSFDLSSSSPSDWTDSKSLHKLYTTENNQPITAKPNVSRHPSATTDTTNTPNLMVFFGTGQFLTLADRNSVDVQSFYGVWDKGETAKLIDLVQQAITQTTINITDSDGGITEANKRTLTTNDVTYSGENPKSGWFIKLPIQKERAVTSPAIRDDTLFFNTFIPSADPCKPVGSGFKFGIDLATGGNPPTTVMDTNGDGIIDSKDDNPDGIAYAAMDQDGYLPDPVFVGDLVFTGREATKVKKSPLGKTGRLSWQELIK